MSTCQTMHKQNQQNLSGIIGFVAGALCFCLSNILVKNAVPFMRYLNDVAILTGFFYNAVTLIIFAKLSLINVKGWKFASAIIIILISTVIRTHLISYIWVESLISWTLLATTLVFLKKAKPTKQQFYSAISNTFLSCLIYFVLIYAALYTGVLNGIIDLKDPISPSRFFFFRSVSFIFFSIASAYFYLKLILLLQDQQAD